MSSSTYFSKHSDFKQDASKPLLEEFNKLSISKNWKKDSKKYQREKQQCIAQEVKAHFSTFSTKLQGWQALLMELSIKTVPNSVKQCKKILRGIWVNLVDLLDARRTGSGPPRKFGSKEQLRKYSVESGKICPKHLAKQDGFIKALLIEMF